MHYRAAAPERDHVLLSIETQLHVSRLHRLSTDSADGVAAHPHHLPSSNLPPQRTQRLHPLALSIRAPKCRRTSSLSSHPHESAGSNSGSPRGSETSRSTMPKTRCHATSVRVSTKPSPSAAPKIGIARRTDLRQSSSALPKNTRTARTNRRRAYQNNQGGRALSDPAPPAKAL